MTKEEYDRKLEEVRIRHKKEIEDLKREYWNSLEVGMSGYLSTEGKWRVN